MAAAVSPEKAEIGIATEIDYTEAFRPLMILRWTFWGLFALVKPGVRLTGSDWMTKALSVLNPGATKRAKLSRYNFAGMGPWMLGQIAGHLAVLVGDVDGQGHVRLVTIDAGDLGIEAPIPREG